MTAVTVAAADLGASGGRVVVGRLDGRRLEVTEAAIRYLQRDGRISTLSRQQGNELRFVKRHAAALSRMWTLQLTIVGTDAVITPLSLFSRRAVRQACRARGWRFD